VLSLIADWRIIVVIMEKTMQNQWSGFDDFELACLCADYGYEDVLDIVEILPVKLANRAEIEALLTKHEFELAFGE
jgi:hypothetical protein